MVGFTLLVDMFFHWCRDGRLVGQKGGDCRVGVLGSGCVVVWLWLWLV